MILRNVHLATMVPGAAPYGKIRHGAVVWEGDRITWVGAEGDLPRALSRGQETLDGGGGWATPGLVDCHTHLLFGGERVAEFEARLSGRSYEEIARAGGGILSTVRATRAASDEALLAGARNRIRDLVREGVTTVEVKSGYGLETETELRMLRLAARAGREEGVGVHTTFLGAHALPEEYARDRAGYLEMVCREMIPRVAREELADCVDAFLETIAFTAEECARVFSAAQDHGLAVRLHADQLSDGGGAALAARFHARSADHLEYTSAAGVRAMAEAGTAAVLLPGAAHFLGDPTVPPVDLFREHGVPMAVATDLNPGSSPLRSPLLAMNFACVRFGLTPEEALVGMTRVAAGVLGLSGEKGTLEVGKRADLVVWEVDHPAELAYWMGGNPCRAVVTGGGPRPS
ncbi:MAG: imidazolonepropionase [Gemmatimonadota bacterium]